MKGKTDQFSPFTVSTPQAGWNNPTDHSVTPEEGATIPEGVSPAAEKKPYRKPSYRYERVFETMALSCGKVSPVEFQCRFNRKNS